jgi:ribonuclease P protein subunit RPR2
VAPPLRILVVGGDTALWVGLSSGFSGRASQLFVPRDFDLIDMAVAGDDVDAVVVVIAADDPDPCAPLRAISAAGFQRRTIVVADRDDRRTAGEALATGVGGYIVRGASIDRIAAAVEQVATGGSMYDSPAAELLHRSFDPGAHAAGAMSAARALASALELKDSYTGGHAERVTALAVRLARAAALDDFPPEALEAAFLLHDVGKIGIPESILIKPAGLTDTERRVLRTHPILGERIIAPLGFPDCVRQVVRHHHERWDGSGYPDGLSGTDIPAPARVFSIADVIDAMTSIRPYRRPVGFERAIAEIVSKAGTQFDPRLCALVEKEFLATAVAQKEPK